MTPYPPIMGESDFPVSRGELGAMGVFYGIITINALKEISSMAISRRKLLKTGAVTAAGLALGQLGTRSAQAKDAGDAKTGPFEPTWNSLSRWECPEWFRDAKFGIWAHWTAQCVPEQGDWYARQMYQQGNGDYNYQCEHYGHPSKVGFKDIDHIWHAENWNPEYLMGLYKAAGAKYFMALGQHHDNFDCFDSKFQTWNSVALGPHKDIVGTWARVARAHGMRFAVSSHGSHAWSWYEVAQGADTTGPLMGVAYDGKLTKADGVGQWWEGLDPQDLYAQNHTPGPGGLQWTWDVAQGSSTPDRPYMDKFRNRLVDLIDKYNPDLVYYDDTVMPLYQVDPSIGLSLAAHLYNTNLQQHHGHLEAVMTGKGLNAQQRQAILLDFERGQSDAIEPLPWQTDTCIGNWHYQRSLYENHQYKTPDEVIKMLVDIVSKNGNLMLNIPLRGDGTIDPDELAFLQGMAAWMGINEEAIYATRPWTISGEGPKKVRGGSFNEGGESALTAQDFRFTTKGNVLYATAMGWPENGVYTLRTLAQGAPSIVGTVKHVELLGHGSVPFAQTTDGLVVTLPATKPCDHAYVLKVIGLDVAASHPAPPPPPVIQADAQGALTLDADDAILHGTMQVQDGKERNIGSWNNPKDTISWRAHFSAPGDYTLAARLATAIGPTIFTVTVAGSAPITVSAPNTNDWNNFQTVTGGPLHISAAGDLTVTVSPADPATWKAMNLASLTLTKV
jgi:alpha-L-fucosidase